jgi:hypothetical protein
VTAPANFMFKPGAICAPSNKIGRRNDRKKQCYNTSRTV